MTPNRAFLTGASKRVLTLLLTISLNIIAITSPAFAQTDSLRINLAHLDFLNQEITLDGQPMLITHIYCEYPDYEWVDAAEEGIACVDDVARSLQVYLNAFERNGDSAYLDKARLHLNFLLHMQADDGEWYNFIDAVHEINQQGPTSRKSFGWWAVRGLRALGQFYRVSYQYDVAHDLRDTLKTRIEMCLPHIEKRLETYGQYVTVEGISIPAWLIGNGSDVTAEAVLALLDYHAVTNDPTLLRTITRLMDGLAQMQYGSPSRFPLGAHLSWQNWWHAWGNSQTQALAEGVIRLQTDHSRLAENYLASARLEADNFYLYLLAQQHLEAIAWQALEPPRVVEFPQIAYGIRCMTDGLMSLYRATDDSSYAQLAGLTASWLFGNNRAQTTMYDPETGRVYDGINDVDTVNRNAGAESTIEGLMALQAIGDNPVASYYSQFKLTEVMGETQERDATWIFAHPDGTTCRIIRSRDPLQWRYDPDVGD